MQVGGVDEVVHGDDGGHRAHVQDGREDVRRVLAVVVDGARRCRPVVQDVVEVAVVDEQHAARLHAALEVGQGHPGQPIPTPLLGWTGQSRGSLLTS